MEDGDKLVAPYAAIDNVLKVLYHVRDRQLPKLVDQKALGLVGVPEGNVSRTLAALRFFKLIDDEGQPTPTFRRLERSGDEFPSLLAEIIKAAYAVVFEYADPATATDTELFRAFGTYEPHAQAQRMITLFKGLCQEAGLMTANSPELPVRRRRARATPNAVVKPTPLAQAQQAPVTPMATSGPDPGMEGFLNRFNGTDNRIFNIMVDKLPGVRGGIRQWRKEDRDAWLHALTAYLDLEIKIMPPTAPKLAEARGADDRESGGVEGEAFVDT